MYIAISAVFSGVYVLLKAPIFLVLWAFAYWAFFSVFGKK